MSSHEEHLHLHEEHDHVHTHEHHAAQQNISVKKLLESMYTHNSGHLDELGAISAMLNEEAKEKVLEAVKVLREGNELLGEAIGLVKED